MNDREAMLRAVSVRVAELSTSAAAKRERGQRLLEEAHQEELLLRSYKAVLAAERGEPALPEQPAFPALVSAPQASPRIADLLAETLFKDGGPMHADELVEALRRQRVPMSAQDPKATVVTALVRGTQKGVFMRVARNTYDLAPQTRAAMRREHELISE